MITSAKVSTFQALFFSLGVSFVYAEIPTATVQRGDFKKTITSIGEMQASQSAIVNAPYRGTVIRVIPEGSRVEENDPVIWMDTEEQEEQLKEEQAQLALAEKDLEAAEEDYRLQEVQNEYDLQSEQAKVELAVQRQEDARQKFETEKILVEKKISAQNRLDEAQLNLLQASVELRNARINLKKTEENLASNLRVKKTQIDKAKLAVDRRLEQIEELNERIDNAVLRAPAAGEVSYLKIWKNGSLSKLSDGDSVWPRLNLVEIPDRSQMLAIVPVNELDISEVESGQPTMVYLDALPGQEFQGIVERKSIVPIENTSRRSSGNENGGPREFEVQIKMGEHSDYFFQGMTASASITVDEIADTLMVPIEAITLEGDEVGVFQVGTSPTFTPVTVKGVNNLYAAVDGSLQNGDEVYLRHPVLNVEEATDMASQALQRVERGLKQKAVEENRRPTEEPDMSEKAAFKVSAQESSG